MSRQFLLAPLFLGTAALALLAPLQPAAATLRALVVGINDYANVPKLKGAVNDANDVTAVLGKAGIEVTTLVDAAATRTAAFEAFQKILGESQPDDVILFHFAGHGVNLPDDNGDETIDKKDEAYLFRDFKDVGGPDIVVDDELSGWFAGAVNKGVKVLFVADACHSGSPTRSVLSSQLPTRLYRPKTKVELPPPLLPEVAAIETESSPDVFAIGATEDNRTVPELPIEGQPRGALSYAVGRAFEGKADKDGDGEVTAGEFAAFVLQDVRNRAASKQSPQFEIPDGKLALLSTRQIAVVADPDTTATTAPTHEVTVFLKDGADETWSAAVEGLGWAGIAPEEAGASVVYDPATGAVINKVGDQVATVTDTAGLVAAIETQRALEHLNKLASAGSLTVDYQPGDQRHKAGTRLTFSAIEAGGKHVTAIDLTGEGTVQYIWPQKGDPDPLPPKRPWEMAADVSPPFGADNLVILVTDTPPTALRDTLTGLNGKKAPREFIEALEAALAGDTTYKLGLQAFFTQE